MRLNNWQKGIAAVLAAQIIWGVAGPLVKIGVSDIPPLSLLFIRCLFASLILFPLYESRYCPKEPKFTRDDKKNLFLAGFIGVFVNIGTYFLGQKLTSVTDTWVIISSGAIFLVLYSYFILGERLPKMAYIGVGLAFVGTLIVVGTPILAIGQGSFSGNLLIFVSTIAANFSYILFKKLVTKFSAVTIAYYSFLVSLPFTLPFFFWDFFKNPTWMAALVTKDYLIIAYLILGSSIAAYVTDNFGLRFLPPSIAATIGYASAIISIALSIIFLHERPTFYFALGAAVVATGLILVETRHSRHPTHRLHRDNSRISK